MVGTNLAPRAIRKRKPRKALWFALAFVLLLMPAIPAIAASSPVRVVNTPGFGDVQNSFSWSMAWFKGSLYVGTVRNEQCVEYATYEFYGVGNYHYSVHPTPYVTCTPDKYDLDLRAEIWRYTPSSTSSGTWQRVYQSPADVPITEEPGKYVARDMGFRGMVVYTDPNTGQQYLFVGGVTAGSFIQSVHDNYAPRILRTSDGVNFTALNGAPDLIYTVHDPVNGEKPIGYRAMIVYKNRLFVTASSGLTGDGVLEEVGQPLSNSPTFTQVSPKGTQVYELAVFNNQLYAGIGDTDNGYGVWRTTATGSPFFNFTQVVTDGAGRGKEISSVVSMYVYNNRLYVGASGWYNTIFPPSEMIRIAPDDSWQLVAGTPRSTPQGFKYPISGLPDGFGNVFNAHFWRMTDISHGLYVGTNDWSWLLSSVPILNTLLNYQFGFDVWGTCDGQTWFRVTSNAFGTGPYNFGARTLLTTPYGAFLGSANHVQGTFVYGTDGTQGLPQCAPFSISDFWNTPFGSIVNGISGSLKRPIRQPSTSGSLFLPGADTSRPHLLQADVQGQGTVLSWDPAQGATQYQILRAPYIPNSQAGVPAPQQPPLTRPNDLPITGPDALADGPPAQGVSVLGNFVNIGTTSDAYFVDSTAVPGTQYAYTVQSVGPSSQVSTATSNMVIVPDNAPSITFDDVVKAINGLVSQGQISQATANSLITMLNSAQSQFDQGNLSQSVQTLGTVVGQVMPSTGTISDAVNAQDLAVQLSSLQRRVALSNIAGTETSTPIDNGTPSSPRPSSGGTTPTGGGGWGSLTNPLFPYGFPSIRAAR